MKEGILLLGHGSRREEANQLIIDIAEQVKERYGEGLYEVGYLSFGEPSLGEAVENLIAAGANRIVVVPIFLVTGNHIKRDIPSKLLLQKTSNPNVEFVMAGHMGADPRIADIIIDRARNASQVIQED
ncbi:MAG: sirohydrochlorin cobaltochelatase [Clostridiales bacterium]|nr:sirohydrochlorin cobaltochelatase [Clostridiales bacterium]MCF8022737.1 sirohydrochlorin cobaltochelatase [Clostridiales bacterium]